MRGHSGCWHCSNTVSFGDRDLLSMTSLLTAVRAVDLTSDQRDTAPVKAVRDVPIWLTFHKRPLDQTDRYNFNFEISVYQGN